MFNKQKKQSLQIRIEPVANQPGDYVAFYKTAILQSTYLLYFKDNILGSIALNTFSVMLAQHYNTKVELCLLDKQAKIKNKALLDLFSQPVLLNEFNQE